VALEYAHRSLAEGRYGVVWWLRAETALTIAEDLAALACRRSCNSGGARPCAWTCTPTAGPAQHIERFDVLGGLIYEYQQAA
jgi:hypothetical protein